MADFPYIIPIDNVKIVKQAEKKSKPPKKPYFRKCWCFSMRTVSLIYGWSGLIICSMILVMMSWVYVACPQIEDSYPILKDKGIVLHIVGVMLASYVLLLTGVYTKNVALLRVFIGIGAICLILQDATLVFHLLIDGGNVYVFMTFLIYTVVIAFALASVASYILQIRREEEKICYHTDIREILKI